MKRFVVILFTMLFSLVLYAEDGYNLWLRYTPVQDQQKLQQYRDLIRGWMIDNTTPTANVAAQELSRGLYGLTGQAVTEVQTIQDKIVLTGTFSSSSLRELNLRPAYPSLQEDGFVIVTSRLQGKSVTVIAGTNVSGMLYGIFHFLRLLQTEQAIDKLSIQSSPRTKVRILNHWDNLDRTIERGYAGFSLWDWHKLPDYIDPRYHDYARANASIGINGTVLTNVNANALILTPMYLKKVAALADVFRPYGIKVYLTARFSAPIEIGGLKTADPLNEEVRKWWREKVKEIYRYVPDFGGFTVKANSEGQPGPQNYGRSHADGANLLADGVGTVSWYRYVESICLRRQSSCRSYKTSI